MLQGLRKNFLFFFCSFFEKKEPKKRFTAPIACAMGGKVFWV